MFSAVDVIENKGIDLGGTEYYAAILGELPSKGARSPILWNAAFKGLAISGVMHPMDILPHRLKEVVDELRKDERFIGGAVTMPYKIDILPFLDAIEPEAQVIGAVNCIYRSGAQLTGTNTDGAGALWSLSQAFGASLEGKNVFLVGTGGAGFAVAAFIASAIGKDGKLLLANRTPSSREEIGQKLQDQYAVEQVRQWPIDPETVKDIDIVINCTSIGFETLKKDERGFYSLRKYSPLGEVPDIRVEDERNVDEEYFKKAASAIAVNQEQSKKVLASMDRPFVFDIVYQPEETVLLEQAKHLGYQVLNGKPMNLEQAVIAFGKATEAAGLYSGGNDAVREIMRTV